MKTPCIDHNPSVFVVDDDPGVLASVEALLGAHGLAVRCFASAEEFLAQIPGDASGCLVTDLRLPGMNGLELIGRLQTGGSPLLMILVTGTSDLSPGSPTMPASSLHAEGLTILEKPYIASDLVRLIRHSLTHSLHSQRTAV